MRPRVFPAEDYSISRHRLIINTASMRPRVFPAEDNVQHHQVACEPADASMRPRVFPAEDANRADIEGKIVVGFNEAAGIPRGRHLSVLHYISISSVGFNEAAGIPRGRPGNRRFWPVRIIASMRPRVFPAEDPTLPHRATRSLPASMRPRVFPAEDAREHHFGIRVPPASMRPRVFPAEDAGPPAARRGWQAASMRPRVFPAEDAGLSSRDHSGRSLQ